MPKVRPKPRRVDRWYFAYGSNLCIDQKQKRTGVIRRAVRCRLTEYRFAFNKRGRNGEVFANIMPAPGHEVWGVVYLCSPAALREMDKHEGVSGGDYRHLPIEVVTDDGEKLNALTYVAGVAFVCEERVPSKTYISRIMRGARHHKLPAAYIKAIRDLAGTARRSRRVHVEHRNTRALRPHEVAGRLERENRRAAEARARRRRALPRPVWRPGRRPEPSQVRRNRRSCAASL